MDTQDESVLLKFIPSSKMAKFIETEVEKIGNEEEVPERIEMFLASEDKSKAMIMLEDLKWVKKRLSLQGRFLCQMLQGTETVLPSPPVEVRNPELEARCQRLRREQEDREYKAMTKMVDAVRVRHPEDSISFQMKQINRQLIGVAQFIFSVAAGFVFGFLGLELMFGNLDMGFRLLCGISCALVIAVAEIYFLIQHLHAADIVPDEPVPGSSGTASVSGAASASGTVNNKPHAD